jgi:ribosome-binding protein aMBF1 (putative translation factor)
MTFDEQTASSLFKAVQKSGPGKSSTRKILRTGKKAQHSTGKRGARRQTAVKAKSRAPRVPARRRSKRLMAHTAAEVAVIIAGARANARQSQLRLAATLKSDQANVVRLEKGRSVPSLRTLFRIAKATGHKLTITFGPLRG